MKKVIKNEKESIENLPKEIWADIEGFEGIYQVSNMGRVKSLARKGKRFSHILRNRTNKKYYQVGLCERGEMTNRKVHQLVAVAFLNHIPCGMDLVVHHIDNDRSNNKLENLEITTNRRNCSVDKKNKTSQYTGVCYVANRSKFKASIWIDSKTKHLGYFTNELEASNKYQEALSNL
tara:strand:- start:3004 stop:3534 length:531 start_codon:yes stop_codon:yes gene_type:complete